MERLCFPCFAAPSFPSLSPLFALPLSRRGTWSVAVAPSCICASSQERWQNFCWLIQNLWRIQKPLNKRSWRGKSRLNGSTLLAELSNKMREANIRRRLGRTGAQSYLIVFWIDADQTVDFPERKKTLFHLRGMRLMLRCSITHVQA